MNDDNPTLTMCTCGHDETFHWAHRGACEMCACLYLKPRRKAATA